MSAQNTHKKHQYCAELSGSELREIQDRIRFDAPSMALCLGIPYETYRNYIYGANAIPANVARAAKELEQINMTFIATLPERVEERIKKEYPFGIPSEL